MSPEHREHEELAQKKSFGKEVTPDSTISIENVVSGDDSSNRSDVIATSFDEHARAAQPWSISAHYRTCSPK